MRIKYIKSMLKKIEEFANRNGMFENCRRIVVGLSGGADSVCLLSVLNEFKTEYGYELTAVHIHHGIRGPEADNDEKFCIQLCGELKIPLKVYHYNVLEYGKENRLTSEEAGRILRYRAFNECAGDGRIAVAHHRNDQAETVIFNICRGSGLAGISGIRPVRDNVIRPLLCCTREEIENYITQKGILYCTDSTNSETEYSRNRIRNIIIPYLEENINSKAVENIARAAGNAGEAERYLEQITTRKYNEAVTYMHKSILLKRTEGEDEYMLGRLIRRAVQELNAGLKDVGEANIAETIKLLNAQKGSRCRLPEGIWAEKTRNGLLFYKDENITEREAVDVAVPSEITPWDDKGKFTFRLVEWNKDKKISNEVYTKCFDYDKIKFSLQLRGYRSEDVIAIDGGLHHKKINRYFIDAGMSRIEKENTVLLADGSHIMWIVGDRMGADYKISDSTVRVLEVTYGGYNDGES